MMSFITERLHFIIAHNLTEVNEQLKVTTALTCFWYSVQRMGQCGR